MNRPKKFWDWLMQSALTWLVGVVATISLVLATLWSIVVDDYFLLMVLIGVYGLCMFSCLLMRALYIRQLEQVNLRAKLRLQSTGLKKRSTAHHPRAKRYDSRQTQPIVWDEGFLQDEVAHGIGQLEQLLKKHPH